MSRHPAATRRSRRATAALAALAAAVITVPIARGGPAAAAAPEEALAVPEFSFEACPATSELPEGADPAAWRCEVMVATGHLRLGRIDQPIDQPMTITFAEGRIDGEFAQVFAEMTAEPLRIRHTPWSITPVYAGFFDFESNDERRGELDLAFALSGPLVPSGCSIGSEAEPVHLVLRDTSETAVISEEPMVVAFSIADEEFATPRTSGCGSLGPVLDRLLRLPSSSGENGIALDAHVALRPYAERNAGTPGPF
jgi:hypothetical protein